MPPRPPRPPRSPRPRRPRSRTATCPVVPRKSSDRLARPPRCRVRDAGLCRPSKQRRIPRPAPDAPQSGMADPCPNAGASPRRTPECASIPEAAPGRRWPCLAAAPSRRISACRPVSRSVGAPTDYAAQGGSKVAPPYHAAPSRHHRRVFSIPHRRCAPAPSRALSLPTTRHSRSRHDRTPRLSATNPRGSDSANVASDAGYATTRRHRAAFSFVSRTTSDRPRSRGSHHARCRLRRN